MRKMLMMCALLMVTMLTNAQDSKKGTYSMGITYGAGYSMLRMDDPYGMKDPEGIANLQGGLAFDYWFTDHIFMETSVTYQRRGWRMDGIRYDKEGEYEIEQEAKTNLHYIVLPMTYNYWYKMRRMGMVYEFGPYFGIGLGGKQKYSCDIELKDPAFQSAAEQLAKSMENETKIFDGDNTKRFDFGLRFGLGTTFGKRMKFMVGYDLGLLNLYRGGNHDMKSKNGTVYGALTFYVK